jgi:type I restriction enzyme M protein
VVDRTLNEWSEWQLKNLNAIVWLYRGENEKYTKLLDDYRRHLLHCAVTMKANDVCHVITPTADFADILRAFEAYEAKQKERAKFDLEHVLRKDKKAQQKYWDETLAAITEAITVTKEAIWLVEKFGEGEYQDIPGLCKMASRAEIAEKNYSLTPGAYVGVAAVEDDGVDFAQRMGEIHQELLSLQAESNELMQTISKNMKEMGL